MLSTATHCMGTVPCLLIDGMSYSTVPELQLVKVSKIVPSEPGGSVRSIRVEVSTIFAVKPGYLPG